MLGGLRRSHRLLGYYSPAGLELAMERTGFLGRLRNRGFADLVVETEIGNPTGDTVRIFAGPSRRELILETRLRIDRQEVPGLALLRIEWLLLQNPRAQFTAERPHLPGQQHPGLGMLADVIALLVLVCDRLQLDGLLFVPAHYHTARQGRKNLRFLSPDDEALLRTLEKTFAGVPLAEASHGVAEGRVLDARTGQPFAWKPMPMALPVSDRLRERVQGEDYERRVAETAAQLEFRLAPG